jgi:hypothetical protein
MSLTGCQGKGKVKDTLAAALPVGHYRRCAPLVAGELVEKGEATMNRKVKPAVISVMVFLLVFVSSTAMAGGKRTQEPDPSEKSCPHQEVKKVQGSKILFQENSLDLDRFPSTGRLPAGFVFKTWERRLCRSPRT